MINLTLTESQYQKFQTLWNKAKEKDLSIRNWTGETVEQIEADYQIPHEEIVNDMVDSFFSQTTGVPMF